MKLKAHSLPAGQLPQLLLATVVVGIVGMMVVPLPTAVLDLLIASNLAGSVLVLAVALYLRDGLGFAAFPSLLLLSTLFRLALNVSSTRLILLQADAGRVIDAFGHFVVRGDYLVGAVVFVILTIIQFAVIARGAERVAEVGARFTLDALPGKQLAIDAEQRSGQLSQRAARLWRRRLDRESQFYGSMDGAMKFVKGDAVASLVITGLNLIAGVGIGSFARGVPLEEAVRTYGLLTIGDGLVSQLPSLLISTAAGLVVTRVASESEGEGSLGSDLASQLVAQPRALWVAAAVTLGLAAVPGFPAWAFLLLAGGLAVAAYARSLDPATSLSSQPRASNPLSVDAIQAELDALAATHPALLACSVPQPFPVTRVAQLLRALAAEEVDAEHVSGEFIPAVLESLAQQPASRPLPALVERVRADLGPRLSGRFVEQGSLRALRLGPLAEDALLDARVRDDDACWLAVEPTLADELVREVCEARGREALPLLVCADLRGPLWRLLEGRCPGVAVLSARELGPHVTVESVAWLGPG